MWDILSPVWEKYQNFQNFMYKIIWQVVRWWHHQLTHLHIHIDWSRNVLWKFAKLQNVITSIFFNRFSSDFHYYVWIFLFVFLKFKLNLFRISPLTKLLCWECYQYKADTHDARGRSEDLYCIWLFEVSHGCLSGSGPRGPSSNPLAAFIWARYVFRGGSR